MSAAGIAIQRVITDAGLVQNRFALFMANDDAVVSTRRKVGLTDSLSRELCKFKLVLVAHLRHLLNIALGAHT